MSRPQSRKSNLSPQEVLSKLHEGLSLKSAFSSLDLKQCQFHEELDTSGYKGPVIPMQGFGGVAKGTLVMTPEAAARCKAQGIPCVTVFPGPDYPQDRKRPEASPAMILGGSVQADTRFSATDHFAIGAATNNMTWLRNNDLTYHYAVDASDTNRIRIGEMTLREGDEVTLDARHGRLYPVDLPIKPIPEVTRSLDMAAKDAMGSGLRIMASAKDHVSVSNAASSTADGIGLLRTEDAIRQNLVIMGNIYNIDDEDDETLVEIQDAIQSGKVYSRPRMQQALQGLLQPQKDSDELEKPFKSEISKYIGNDLRRAFYFSNKDQGFPHKHYIMTYRLSDLSTFVPELADESILTFGNRKRFYDLQVNAMLSAMDNPLQDRHGNTDSNDINFDLRILIPFANNARELSQIKEIVNDAARKHGFVNETGQPRFKFGAKIETKEAAEPEEAAKIAKLCDFVDFDTNDLTKSVTGLKRDDLDPQAKAAAKAWMDKMRREQRGYEKLGDSPFDALVPEVTRAMAAAATAMRRANPAVELGCCGRQVAENSHSIEACVKMGLDNISVPSQHVMGAHITAAHFAAKEQAKLAGRG